VPGAPLGTDSLIELLDLEELDTDLYRAVNENSAVHWPALFGGQVAAQALRAAGYTVPEGRLPHSLHGYFLRPGRSDHHVILKVARDRDGRSFSARHVVAVQEGEVIFSMSASFHTPRPSQTFESQRPPPPAGPEELVDTLWHSRFDSTLEVKSIPALVPYREDQWPVSARMWVKPRELVPDDPMIRACILTYVSDLGTGFGDGQAHPDLRGGPSIDHAMWFDDDIPVQDWLYLDSWPVKAGGSRGVYSGEIRSAAGELGAILTQEVLFRADRPPPVRPE
jgi:acyl-CoA thioesterase-2